MVKRKKSTTETSIDNMDLDGIIEELSAQFGKGVAFRGGDTVESYDKGVINTGILSLDQALGIGGIPVGKIIELFGNEMCVSKNNYINSCFGLLTVEELYKHLGFETTTRNRVEDIKDKNLTVHTETKDCQVSHLIWNGKRQTYKITTKAGFKLQVTANHPIKIIDKNGFMRWEKTENIKKGTYVVVNRKEIKFPTQNLKPELSRLLGYLVADGCLTVKNTIHFSNSNSDVISDFYSCMEKIDKNLIIHTHPKQGSKGVEHQINNKEFRNLLFTTYGLDYVKAAGKSVPLCIRKSGRETWIQFLKAYFECESGTQKDSVSVSSASSILIDQIQLMLLSFGIVSHQKSNLNKKYNRNYYRLRIHGKFMEEFIKEIGFISKECQEKCKIIKNAIPRSINPLSIPYQKDLLKTITNNIERNKSWDYLINDNIYEKCNLTYDRLSKILEYLDTINASHPIIDYWKSLNNLYFDPVVSIEDAGSVPTFDLTQPETHSFTVNGIINHNSGKSSLALRILSNAQRQGFLCFFIDAEHALNLNLASNIGVDINSPNFIISQPSSGDEAFAIIEFLLDKNTKSLFIVDSVAALLPKEELEAGFLDPERLGRQAALMSRGLRKLSGKLNNTNCTAIFVNQTRAKISRFMPVPGATSTPGGFALKFYSSIRIKVIRCEQIKHNGAVIGHVTKLRVEKNKLATPFKEVSVDLLYGSGFSSLSDLVKIAVNSKIMEKSGAWYSFNNQKLAGGFINTLEFLVAHPDIYSELQRQVLELFNLTDPQYTDIYYDKHLIYNVAGFGESTVEVESTSPSIDDLEENLVHNTFKDVVDDD